MPPEPAVRALTEEEWPDFRMTLNQVFRPAGGDLTRESPLLFAPGNQQNLRVIVQAGDAAPGAAGGEGARPRVLAHAGVLTRDAMVRRRAVRIACIGGVFTVAERRGQGLATRALQDVLRRVRPNVDLVMASGDRELYRRQGFDPVPPLARFRLPAAWAPARDLLIREVTAGDLDDLAALHDAEEVRFLRTRDDWRALWGAGMLVDAPATFWVAERAGRTIAYLVAQRAGTRSDGSARPRRILEVGGDRAAVTDAAPAVADELLVPVYDAATIAAAERHGWTRTTRQFLITALPLTAQIVVIPWYGLDYL